MGNRCIPTQIESIVNVIEQSELVQALHNILLVGSLNGVSKEDVVNTVNLTALTLESMRKINLFKLYFIIDCMQIHKLIKFRFTK